MAARRKKVATPKPDRSGAMEKLATQFADRLRELRGDLSQRQFAAQLGVFQQNVNRYENGVALPHVEFLYTLAERGVSIDWLILGRGKKPNLHLEAAPKRVSTAKRTPAKKGAVKKSKKSTAQAKRRAAQAKKMRQPAERPDTTNGSGEEASAS